MATPKKNHVSPTSNAGTATPDELRQLVESFAQALWETDAQGQVVTDSPSWRAYTGQSPEDWLGEGWLSAVHPSDQAQARHQWHQAVAQQTPFSAEFRLRSPDGGWRWTNVRAVPIRNAQGVVQKWVGLNIDVNAQKEAEAQVAQSEQLLRTLIGNLPGGAAFVVDHDLRYQVAEGEVLRQLGLRSADFVGKTVAEAAPPDAATPYEALYRQALAGESFVYEHAVHNRYFSSKGVPLRTPDGAIYAVLVVSYDMTDRQRSKEQLQAIEANQRAILDSANQSIMLIAPDYSLQLFNRFAAEAAQTVFGQTMTVGQSMLDYVAPADQASFRTHFEQTLAGQEVSVEKEVAGVGEPSWWEFFFYPIRQPDGRVSGVTLTSRNISARKQTERQLREAEEAYRTQLEAQVEQRTAELSANHRLLQATMDSSLDLIQVFEAVRDENGAITDFRWVLNNHAAEQIYGDVIGQRLLARNPGVLEAGIFETFKRVVDTGRPEQAEHHYVHEEFNGWFLQSVVKVDDGIATTTADITERKRAEHELLRLKGELAQRATDRYLALYNAIDEGFCIIEMQYEADGQPADFRYVDVNPAFEAQTGLGNVVGKTLRNVVADPDPALLARYAGVDRTGESVRFTYWVASSGQWFDIYAARIGRPDEHQLAVLFNDITDRKRREADQKLMIDIAGDLGRLSGEEQIVQHVGAKLAAYLKLACYHYVDVNEERAEVTIRHFWHTQDVPYILETYPLAGFISPDGQQSLRAGEPSVVSNVQQELPGDTAASAGLKAGAAAQKIAAYVAVPYSQGGVWKAYFAVADSHPRRWTSSDIELIREVAGQVFPRIERARVEKALRESEERLRLATEAADMYAWEIDLRTGVPTFSANVAQVIGHQPTASFEDNLRHIHPDDQGVVRGAFDAAIQNGTNRFDYEMRSVVAGRPMMWFRVSGVLTCNPQGQPVRAVGISQNITARKQSQEALRLANERFRLAEAATNGFIYDWNTQTGAVTRSDGFGRVLGYEPGEVPETAQAWAALIHPDDRSALPPRLIADEHNEQVAYGIEYRVRAKDGHYRYVLDRALVMRNEQGDVVRMVGSTVDITEGKRAEEALRESEERLRLAAEAADLGTWEWHLLTNEVYWNEQHFRLFGTQPLPLPITPDVFTSYVHPDDRDWVLAELNRAIQHRTVYDVEFRAVCEDGSLAWMSGYGRVTAETGGKPSRMNGVMFDITERKSRAVNGALLADIGNDFARLTSPDDIMRAVGEKLYAYFALNRLAFAYVHPETNVVTTVYDQHDTGLLSALGSQPLATFSDLTLPQLSQDGRVVAINNVVTDPRTAPYADAFARFGAGALLVAPFVSEGKWRFAITLQKSEPYAWRPDQIELLEDVVPRLYLALERLRFEALKHLTLLQQTEDLASVGSWEFNRETGQFSWSPGMYRLFELPPEQAVSPQTYIQFANDADQHKAEQLVAYLRTGQGRFDETLRIRTAAGNKTLRVKASVIGEGNQQRVLGVDVDITEQLLAQRQIQETAENLQAVLDGSPAAIGLLKAVHDAGQPEPADFCLAVGNVKLAEFFGQPLDELLGQSAGRFSALLWDGHTLDILRRVYQTRESLYQEQQLANDKRWLAIAVTCQDDGVLLTALDITELKAIQHQQQHWLSELEQTRQSADALSELRASLLHRSELLRAVSHDLRGNFGVIQGAVQLLGMAASEAERAQMLDMVLRNVKQATGLLTELLDYARLEAGQEQRSMGPMDVTPLLQELCQSLQPLAAEQGLWLQLKGPDALRVQGDRLHVHRMAQNLIINALKYTHTGGVTVAWGEDAPAGRWWFSVTDTGPGLDAALVARLNAPIPEGDELALLASQPRSVGSHDARGRTSWTHLRGEGIGLRIVQQLAGLLGAQLQVSSQPGVGTQFLISFPLRDE